MIGPNNDVDNRRLSLTGDSLVSCNRYVDMDIAFVIRKCSWLLGALWVTRSHLYPDRRHCTSAKPIAEVVAIRAYVFV